jgi:hypothetical protein
MIILGADPGISESKPGAIAALDHNGNLLAIRELPLKPLEGNGVINTRLDGAALIVALRELVPANEAAIVYVEDVQPMFRGQPDNVAASMAALYASKIAIYTALDLFASRMRIEPVPAATWKSFHGLKMDKDKSLSLSQRKTRFKAASRAKALELYPEAAITLAKHDGRAESLLIAIYGRDHEGFRDDLLAEPKPAPIHVKRTDIDIDQHFGRSAT